MATCCLILFHPAWSLSRASSVSSWWIINVCAWDISNYTPLPAGGATGHSRAALVAPHKYTPLCTKFIWKALARCRRNLREALPTIVNLFLSRTWKVRRQHRFEKGPKFTARKSNQTQIINSLLSAEYAYSQICCGYTPLSHVFSHFYFSIYTCINSIILFITGYEWNNSSFGKTKIFWYVLT
jgi:hypothetical protein